MQFSLVVPLLNESESLEELYRWIEKSLNEYSFELLFVDDGSTDDSWSIITELAKKHDTVKGIRFAQNFGKSQALHAAFSEVQGKYVVTLDADLQDSPEEILPMVALMEEKQWDLISGWKKNATIPSFSKTYPLACLIGQQGMYLASIYMTSTAA